MNFRIFNRTVLIVLLGGGVIACGDKKEEKSDAKKGHLPSGGAKSGVAIGSKIKITWSYGTPVACPDWLKDGEEIEMKCKGNGKDYKKKFKAGDVKKEGKKLKSLTLTADKGDGTENGAWMSGTIEAV